MSLLNGYVTWVSLVFIELFALVSDFSTGGDRLEVIYAILIVTLVVGMTGLNLYSKMLKEVKDQ